ncbi:AI-2E family transporter [Aliiroseovarius sp. Z3]|uniref:AI-2E family transporter n=1 Tax=Aliiroseovarius sp. Z3 TaxID=2811402 RepID=UPI0023B2E025|nr:AI-2E family transporter [Aliiroseovarius sp. Z3]MDE9449944.1 AI-2E family transporter [Aliiroseovarius sp. Z3]
MEQENHIKALRRSAGILAVIGVFSVIYFARDLILPVMLGFIIAITLSPIARTLIRNGFPSGLVAGFLVMATGCAIIAVIYLAGGTVATWVEDAPNIGRELEIKLRGLSDAFEAVQEASKEVERLGEDTGGGGGEETQPLAVERPGLLTSAVAGFASSATTIAVALILAFFLLASGELFYTKLVQSFSSMKEKKRALTVVYEIQRRVSRYLLTITVINAALGVAIGTTLWMIGLKSAVIWGIAAFLLNYLPFIGGLIGTILVGAYAIITFDSVAYALIAPICYQTLTTLEGQFLTPYFVGRQLEMNTVSVFLAVVVWTWLWGVSGALLAVPFLLVFKAIADEFDGLKPVGNFLGR